MCTRDKVRYGSRNCLSLPPIKIQGKKWFSLACAFFVCSTVSLRWTSYIFLLICDVTASHPSQSLGSLAFSFSVAGRKEHLRVWVRATWDSIFRDVVHLRQNSGNRKSNAWVIGYLSEKWQQKFHADEVPPTKSWEASDWVNYRNSWSLILLQVNCWITDLTWWFSV